MRLIVILRVYRCVSVSRATALCPAQATPLIGSDAENVARPSDTP
jgi:hypothetical protein